MIQVELRVSKPFLDLMDFKHLSGIKARDN